MNSTVCLSVCLSVLFSRVSDGFYVCGLHLKQCFLKDVIDTDKYRKLRAHLRVFVGERGRKKARARARTRVCIFEGVLKSQVHIHILTHAQLNINTEMLSSKSNLYRIK
jgi:hypothetical protein